jgi:hypothetical protein
MRNGQDTKRGTRRLGSREQRRDRSDRWRPGGAGSAGRGTGAAVVAGQGPSVVGSWPRRPAANTTTRSGR